MTIKSTDQINLSQAQDYPVQANEYGEVVCQDHFTSDAFMLAMAFLAVSIGIGILKCLFKKY